MPIIGWSEGDLLRFKRMEPGVYAAHLKEARASRSEKGNMNLFLTFTISAGDFTGKEVDINLSTGNKNRSVLGGTVWAPMGMLAVLKAAVDGIPPESVKGAGQVDTDELINKEIGLQIGAEVFEGNPINTIINFLPAAFVTGGTQASTAAPF